MAKLFSIDCIGVYELWLLVETPGNSVDFKQKVSGALHDVSGELSGSKLCGAFHSEFGDCNSTVVIWQHETFDNTKKLRNEWSLKGDNKF